MVFKHKLIYNAAPGIRIRLFLFLETLTPTAELAGASLRALVSLGAAFAGFCARCVKLRLRRSSQPALLELGNVHPSVLQQLWEQHPSWKVGIKSVGWKQSLKTSAVTGRVNVFEAVTVWEIRLELSCCRCYCLKRSTFLMAVF